MRAWHFVKDDRTLRDGSPLPAIGETLRHAGPLVACESGLHASVRCLDALRYAPGSILCRVECGGELVEHGEPVNKICCRERTILAVVDAGPMLHEFACWCAEQALAMIPNPDPRSLEAIRVKRAWLKGEATDAGLAAARAAAWAAARAAAYAAARDAAARAAVYAAARDAAAWDAARAAARAAAYAAARDAAARDAARAAAWDAAQAAELERRALALVEASGQAGEVA